MKGRSLSSSDVTPKHLFLNRRQFLKTGSAAGLLGSAGLTGAGSARAGGKLKNVKKTGYTVDAELTTRRLATTYNNFYEFGSDKRSPAYRARSLKTDPWSVAIGGEAGKTGTFGLEDILRPHPLEERVYRFRCVEAWSMVVPWIGFPLADLLKRFEPTARAKFVEFTTLHDPDQMPRQKDSSFIQWPYVEGLRLDEAMHPLTMMVVGYYGETLENQSGAPLRLIVPWKYGFKSIKSIVRIRLTSRQPATTWNLAIPQEYGFYANVNPSVDHPRWSQATERRLGQNGRIDTLPLNGYAEQVAHLYEGMDLRKNY